MDDRRFDSLARSLASGASRRSVLKGILGLGGAALAGSVILDRDSEAARRPTNPTPTPVRCPGNQVSDGVTCVCPATALNKCGPDCCTGLTTDDHPAPPDHSECCDNECCLGTCYGEAFCCPTNIGDGESPPTHKICDAADGPHCCAYDQRCCLNDGCCNTVCGGSRANNFCCSEASYCPSETRDGDVCCEAGQTCCGPGMAGNACVDLRVANSCCTSIDCEQGETCANHICVPEDPCGGACLPSETCVGSECLCKPGSFDSGTVCVLCAPGSFSDSAGAVSCQPCGLNTYQDLAGQTGCTPCPVGWYTEHVRATACTQCDCSIDTMPPICDCSTGPCQPGYVRDGLGVCNACPGGTEGADGLTCERCGPGTYAPVGSVACLLCVPGTYTDDSENDECNPCPEGYYSDVAGATECLACPLGTYSNSSPSSACLPCLAGTYTEHIRATACIDCACGETCDPTNGACA